MTTAIGLLHGALPALLPRLRRFARSLAGSVDDADDLVQLSLERALTRIDQWRAPEDGGDLHGAMRAWLFGILRNAWIDELRARGRERPHLAPEEAGATVGDRSSEQLQERLSLQAAMDRLPEEQRLAVCLVLVEGLSYREAASVLDIPEGTLTSRLSRGRDAMAALLAEPGERK